MRFMMLVYPGPKAETGAMPDEKVISAMTKYNEELAKTGILLGMDGLQASAKGARVRFAEGKSIVTDGPFAESKELIGGYWIIQVNSKEEAIAWARRAPMPEGEMIELRQMFEPSDFGPEVAEKETAILEEISRRTGQNKTA